MTHSLKIIGLVSFFFTVSLPKHRPFLAPVLPFHCQTSRNQSAPRSPSLIHSSFGQVCLWPFLGWQLPPRRSQTSSLLVKPKCSHYFLAWASSRSFLRAGSYGSFLGPHAPNSPPTILILKIIFCCCSRSLPRPFSLLTLYTVLR